MRTVVLSLVIFTLLSCASRSENFVFDGSSEETIQRDISHMLNVLPKRKQIEFYMALLAIQFSDVNSVYDFIGDPAMESINYHILSKKLDGLTYDQVIELASCSQTKVEISIN